MYHVPTITVFLSTKQKQSFPVYVPNFCADLLTNKAEIKSLDDSNFIRNFEKYRVFKILKEGFYNIPVFQSFFHREKLSKRWSNFVTEETKWILSTLPIIQKLSERTGGKFHLFYYPNTNRIEAGDIRHFYWQEFITKVFDQYGILLQDPYPYFINIAPRKSMTWSLTDHHPSCDAHGVMAKYVDSIIRKDSD